MSENDYIPDPANYVMKAPRSPAKEMPVIRTDMTPDEWKAVADSKLQELLQTASGSLLLAAIRESKDRLEGRPVQRTDARVLTQSKGDITIKLVD